MIITSPVEEKTSVTMKALEQNHLSIVTLNLVIIWLSLTDLFDALHYGEGVSNAKVVVVEINSSQSEGQEIHGINSYHSAKFFEDHMRLYRYFEIGSGKVVQYIQPYFMPCYTTTNDFSNTSNNS